MTARILRTELRRSSARWAALLIVAIAALPYWSLVAVFGSEGKWFGVVTSQRTVLVLLCPIALVAGALQARRDRSSQMEELLATTPRPALSRVFPVTVAMAAAMYAAYLVTLGAFAAIGLRRVDVYFPAGAIPVIAIGALALAAAACLGLAIGRQLPWLLTPPVLGVAGLFGMFLSLDNMERTASATAGSLPSAFLLQPPLPSSLPINIPQAFLTVSARTNLMQALWLVALAATGLALFAASSRRARVLAFVPALVAAAVAITVLPDRIDRVYTVDRGAFAPVCTPDTPKVCVNSVDAPTALDEWREPGRQALAALAAKLPHAPDRVEVYLWMAPDVTERPRLDDNCPANICRHPPRGTQTLIFEFAYRGYREPAIVLRHEYVWHLLAGGGTSPCADLLVKNGNLDLQYIGARFAAAAWLLGEPLPFEFNSLFGEPGEVQQPTREALRNLTSLSEAEQRTRVNALRQAELTCAPGDRMQILTGRSAQS